MNNLTKEQWAYVAGFMDGDGHISSRRYDSTQGIVKKMIITQKNIAVLEYFQHLIDAGSIGTTYGDYEGGKTEGLVPGVPYEAQYAIKWLLENGQFTDDIPEHFEYLTHLRDKYGKLGTRHEDEKYYVRRLSFAVSEAYIIAENIYSFLRLKKSACGDLIKTSPEYRGIMPDDEIEKDLFWPYFAGLMDSDGLFGIYNQSVTRNGKSYTYATPTVNLSQVDKPFLESLKKSIGFGSVSKRGKTGSGRQMYYLTFGSAQSKEVCEKIIDFLVFKTDKAQAIIDHKPKRPSNLVQDRPEAQEAKRRYLDGESVAIIAKDLEQKPATVNYWLKRMGVTRSFEEAQRLRRQREKGREQ